MYILTCKAINGGTDVISSLRITDQQTLIQKQFISGSSSILSLPDLQSFTSSKLKITKLMYYYKDFTVIDAAMCICECM